ncbi:fumarylacetoacetate hydrolase family protein [Micrococcales bacterium 31B]|nr:fumarylacetoacetate hydrolase family protein [Micrococcales bacterium 31B]
MKLYRFGPLGSEIPVAQSADGTYFDAREVTRDFDAEFFASGGLDTLRERVATGSLPGFDPSGLRIGAPVTRPGVILCIGQNYVAHAAETGDPPPAQPIIFFKHPNTLAGPADDIAIPPAAVKVDWEVELAVVIGKTARYLESPDEALDYVAGYGVSNDVSERDYQMRDSGGQWSKGKCCETFNPMGPYLAVDEIDDPQSLGLRSFVNGEPRQDSNTNDMIFSVAAIIHHLSQFLVLSPGDIINTGTPQGVAISGKYPYLVNGDTVEVAIDGLGSARQSVKNAIV